MFIKFRSFLLMLLPLLFGALPISCISNQLTDTPRTTSFDIRTLSEYSNLVPVAVIGSGAAGLGAAFVSSSKKFQTIVFQGPIPRGQLNYERPVRNWLGAPHTPGKVIMQNVEDQAKEKEAIISNATITSCDFSKWPFILKTEEGITIHALAVIIATGSSPKTLGIPGEKEYLQKGLDTEVYKKDLSLKTKSVIVIGSGEDAISKVMRLQELSAQVTLLVRSNALNASDKEIAKLKKNDASCKIIYNAKALKFLGNQEKLTGVEADIEGQVTILPTDRVVIAIGKAPNSAFFMPYINCDEEGYIILNDHTQQTSLPGVFAAGGVTDKLYGQAIISCAEGMKAGYDTVRFLKMIKFTKEEQASLKASLFVPNTSSADKK